MIDASDQPAVELPAIKPTPKQAEFLAASEDELLFGGAAGSGKTYILEVDPLGLNEADGPAIQAASYRAVIIRRSYPDLIDFRNRCMTLYPQITPGVKWKESESCFIFPSGARITLRHLRDEHDLQHFQGQELQYVGWDELTHQPSPALYEYLKSRLRSVVTASGTLKKYTRATTNPGGPGHEWVKEHWRIPDEGSDTCFKVEVRVDVPGLPPRTETRWRRFIAARVTDNPHVDPDYVVTLASLNDDLRAQLLLGRWDVVDTKGVIFGTQMDKARRDDRICHLPWRSGLPVNTFWDIGRDATSIWFHQHVDGWDHFIDYVQDEQKELAYFVNVVLRKPYLYGTHFFPHDAQHKNVLAGETTMRTLAEAAGLKPIVVVPQIPNINTGIDLTRQAIAGCRFDRAQCFEGLKALRNYQFKYDLQKQIYSDKPLHNWASHAADAFRQFAQGYRSNAVPGHGTGVGAAEYRRRREYKKSDHDKLRNPRTRHIV